MRHEFSRGCDEKCNAVDERCEDEMLEAIWTLREEGKLSVSEALKRADVPNPQRVLEWLCQENKIEVNNENVLFTEKGEKKARKVIRQHRLAEALVYQVMNLDEDELENAACRFEHGLNPEVTESICTLLGHPRTCPHGKPIPSAKCCERFRTEIQPLVQRLSDLGVGQSGRVTMIAPKYHSRIERLGSFGLTPGAQIKLKQKFPSFVIDVGETTLAIDNDIANEILVRLTAV